MKASEPRWLITCEHGGNDVPPEYRHLFDGMQAQLQSHRGRDAGALLFARELADALDARLIHSTITRLLVDLNRSPGHRDLMPAAASLDRDGKQRLLNAYYWPYRNRVHDFVRDGVAGGNTILHISAHSFTPELDGRRRNADIGLLYDPGRAGEKHWSRLLKQHLRARLPELRVRFNYPYRGTADGLTTWLRRRFGGSHYLGVEIELNQSFAAAGPAAWQQYRRHLIEEMRATTAGPDQ